MYVPSHNFFHKKKYTPKLSYGFITETPLDLIQEKKMTRDPINPLINYQKNLKNTARFSKRFNTNTLQTENDFSPNETLSSKQSISKEDDQEKNQLQELKNYDVTKHINSFFPYKTTDLFTKFIKSEHDYEEIKPKKLTNVKNRINKLCPNPKELYQRNFTNTNEISLESLRPKTQTLSSTNNFKHRRIRTPFQASENEIFQSKDTLHSKEMDQSFELTKSKGMNQIILKLRSSECSPSLGLCSPFSLGKSPLMSFSKKCEDFKDLSKLELRKKIFRKYSLTKREKKTITQKIVDEYSNFKPGEIDLDHYINKRKEFEVFYEDDLYKAGYFNEIDHQDYIKDYVLKKKEKESGLIQRDVTGAMKSSVIKMKPGFKKDIENGTNKLYNKYFNEKIIPEENEKDVKTHGNDEKTDYLRGKKRRFYA